VCDVSQRISRFFSPAAFFVAVLHMNSSDAFFREMQFSGGSSEQTAKRE
jgi:hypothetical protein